MATVAHLSYLLKQVSSLGASRKSSLECFMSSLKSQVLYVKSLVKSHVATQFQLFATFGAFIHELRDANLRNLDPPYPHNVLWWRSGEEANTIPPSTILKISLSRNSLHIYLLFILQLYEHKEPMKLLKTKRKLPFKIYTQTNH